MKDNFDIYAWNRNNLLENSLEDADLKAKQRVDTLYNQIISEFPDKFESSIEKSQLRYTISSAFTDLALNENEIPTKKYVVQYWIYRNDDYDDDEIEIEASSEEEAIQKAEQEVRRGKNFKVIDILKEDQENPIDTITTDVPLFIRLLEYAKEDAETDMDLHNVAENAIRLSNNSDLPLTMDNYDNIVSQEESLSPVKETFKFIMENPEGYSKYFPGGKTKGLDKDTLSTILMQILKDTEEEGKRLDESTKGKQFVKNTKKGEFKKN